MVKIIKALVSSLLLQVLLTLFAYAIYISAFAVCATPSVYLIIEGVKHFYPRFQYGYYNMWDLFLFVLLIAAAFYLFFVVAVIVLGSLIRILSLGIKPGEYRIASATFLRWLFFSGLYNVAIVLVLPMVRMTFFTILFYKLVGCRMGKNVQLNTWTLPDAYLLTLGDNVVVGARSEIVCHIFQGGVLMLKEVKIGDNTLVGAHCYISCGVEIGKNCVIGLKTLLRKNTRIPDNTKIGTMAGLPIQDVYRLENEIMSGAKIQDARSEEDF